MHPTLARALHHGRKHVGCWCCEQSGEFFPRFSFGLAMISCFVGSTFRVCGRIRIGFRVTSLRNRAYSFRPLCVPSMRHASEMHGRCTAASLLLIDRYVHVCLLAFFCCTNDTKGARVSLSLPPIYHPLCSQPPSLRLDHGRMKR
jgi:hypothetical protein